MFLMANNAGYILVYLSNKKRKEALWETSLRFIGNGRLNLNNEY